MIAQTYEQSSKTEESYSTSNELEFFKPLINGWLGKIEASKRHREPWKRQADECMNFYSLSKKLSDLLNSGSPVMHGINKAPKFQMVINKAFELVAQIGPSLFFNSPDRKVEPKRLKDLPPTLFGDVENDPNAQQLFQAYQMEQMQEDSVCQARATLMESWLNYTPREMPGGGLEKHAQRAITEALVKGRGVLWAEPYQKAASDKMLTGLFYDSVDNLFLDPDATKLEDVRWIAQRCVEHYRDVEERFGLPRNSLKGKASLESMWAEGEKDRSEEAAMYQANGTGKDLVLYYKVYSKSGLGVEFVGGDQGVLNRLDQVVGKYGYLAVCPSCPYPLNAPTRRLRDGATDEEVRDMFEWPIPLWADDAWPCEILDFYEKPNSIWPIPPLAPAMGELKFMSIMMSHLCNRIWMSSRSFIAVAKSAMSEVESIIKRGDDLSVMPISDVHGGVEKMVSFLKQPEVNMDAFAILEKVSELFERRTGLSDLVYGMSATQSRSAQDAATKGQAISVRPEYMQRQVERWMGEASRKEAFCTRWFVDANDVVPLIGRVGAAMWSELIDTQDVDVVIREMEYTIAAGSSQRRNKELEMANVNQALQFFFPEFSKHADATTDTSALNTLIQRWGETAQIDMSDLEIGPRMPPPPPEQEGPSPEEIQFQMEQEKHQLEMQTAAQEHQMKMAESQAKMAEMQARLQSQQTGEHIRAQSEQMKISEMQAKMQSQQSTDAMKLQSEQMKLKGEIIKQHSEMAKFEDEQDRAMASYKNDLMDMLMGRQKHEQDLRHQEEAHDQNLELASERAEHDLLIARQKAAAALSSTAKNRTPPNERN